MPNYKPHAFNSLEIAGIQKFFYRDESIKILTLSNALLQTTDSLEDSSTGSVYVVPTGKTFNAIGVALSFNGSSGKKMELYEGDTENAETTLKFSYSLPTVADWYYLPSFLQISSGKWLVLNPEAGLFYIYVLGYET